mmetsp:Transcript_26473/g.54931  ORF Transcript_26473/g.54931 Transcript_26473/m.54931 type:complete len:231 (-) Transcript_26473:821-1513(-)
MTRTLFKTSTETKTSGARLPQTSCLRASRPDTRASLHHLAELLPRDLAIPVSVNLLHNAVQPRHVVILQDLLQFVPVYLTTAVCVKDAECCPQHLSLHVLLCRQCCSDELCVVNCAGSVGVHCTKHLLEICRHCRVVCLHTLYDLSLAQRPVLVLVQRAEYLLEPFDLLLFQVLRDKRQSDLLQLGRTSELSELRPKVGVKLARLASLESFKPRMFKERTCARPVSRIES